MGKKKREGTAGSGNRSQGEQRRSSYRMVLFKEFGDTILVGGEPRLVGARIEEVAPDAASSTVRISPGASRSRSARTS